MKTFIEVYDDLLQAQARVEQLKKAGAKNPRLLEVERLSAQDRRPASPPPPDWVRTKADANLQMVQYER